MCIYIHVHIIIIYIYSTMLLYILHGHVMLFVCIFNPLAVSDVRFGTPRVNKLSGSG